MLAETVTLWPSIISGVFSLLTAVLAGYVSIKMAQITRQGTIAAEKVETVRQVAALTSKKVETVATLLEQSNTITSGKLEAMAIVGQKTHALVNSAMGVQLRLNMVMSRRIADMPNATEADIKAALMAEAAFADHERKQKEADALQGKTVV